MKATSNEFINMAVAIISLRSKIFLGKIAERT